MRSRLTTTVAAVVGGLAYPAHAGVDADTAGSQVKIAKPAGLYGEGAVILVDVSFRCAGDADEGYVYLRVSQVDGPYGTVYGEGWASVICTGAPDTVSVAVPGYSTFADGQAFATAELQTCSDFECSTTESAREVKVVPGTREDPSYRSDELTYRLPKTAEIQAEGAGAIVLVPYTCDAGLMGQFEASLAQATADGFVETSGDSSEMRCSATSRTGILAFHAYTTGWEPGDAFLLVNGYACEPDGPCTNGATYRTTKLV